MLALHKPFETISASASPSANLAPSSHHQCQFHDGHQSMVLRRSQRHSDLRAHPRLERDGGDEHGKRLQGPDDFQRGHQRLGRVGRLRNMVNVRRSEFVQPTHWKWNVSAVTNYEQNVLLPVSTNRLAIGSHLIAFNQPIGQLGSVSSFSVVFNGFWDVSTNMHRISTNRYRDSIKYLIRLNTTRSVQQCHFLQPTDQEKWDVPRQ